MINVFHMETCSTVYVVGKQLDPALRRPGAKPRHAGCVAPVRSRGCVPPQSYVLPRPSAPKFSAYCALRSARATRRPICFLPRALAHVPVRRDGGRGATQTSRRCGAAAAAADGSDRCQMSQLKRHRHITEGHSVVVISFKEERERLAVCAQGQIRVRGTARVHDHTLWPRSATVCRGVDAKVGTRLGRRVAKVEDSSGSVTH